MKPSDALTAHRDSIHAAVLKCRAANPRVFGAVLRGEDRDGSDLDLLVDALPGATLFDLGALQVELEALLGVRFDAVTPGDLPIALRKRLPAEAVPLSPASRIDAKEHPDRLAGTWSEAHAKAFEFATARFNQVDSALRK